MKVSMTLKERKRTHVIEQLTKYSFYDVEDMSYRELVGKLAMLRALEVEIDSPEKEWF